ncbi:purine-nucleoside phosphorylase [Candidatus Bipolaricaulota bacterium]|nr:purine-nucleoside phosphorylase [Candidatus Bipolaricaulota bacterium]
MKERLSPIPGVAVILGSGMSEAFGVPDGGVRIPWQEIPGFPLPTVAGHAGEFWAGKIEGKEVLIQRGRIHFYEGYPMEDVVFSTRLFGLLGIRTLIVTNASGAINPELKAGDLVLITDHINMLGENPLRGPNLDQLGPRFPDMSAAYSNRLREIAISAARAEGIELKQGVYIATLGPSYETPAEIRAFRTLGADLVGMSTVPEVIAANHARMEVLGISCATNLAAGVNPDATLSHEEVIETTRRKGEEMRRLIYAIVSRL